MTTRNVTLRQMTSAEYAVATEQREAETARVLGQVMSEAQAWERTRKGTAQFLPDGLGTARHHLVAAEDAESGEVVGFAWIGPDPRQAVGTADAAWLYDIRVLPPHRRRGYGSAMLRAAEVLVAEAGWSALGLNVAGDNEAAIALYRRAGYEVSSMSLRKEVRPAGE
ncbi:GNAT family N-acetyltransferase [Kitasatospora sp. NPDC006697]|uniref:GNAT family N-acetyltransferase n=1 Tax=Kitasatospora sp. NPDC006697 TaxID=3364020 RepID=UPI00368712EA